MRELRREQIGDRRVRLVVDKENRYTVTIEVRGPQGTWEDISLIADGLWRCTPQACAMVCA
jgi:hypothetical protein